MNKLQLIFSRARSAKPARIVAGFLLFAFFSPTTLAAPLLAYEVLATLPHDVRDFTQGLAIHEGELFESTGHFGNSALLRKKLDDGTRRQRRLLPDNQFGEGVALAGARWIQLTWSSGVAWIYDLSLRRTGTFRYNGEGWGLTFDGTHLLMSDGSSRITRRRADTFERISVLDVRDDNAPVMRLNELEFANGWLYANVWQTDRVAVIDPVNGVVRGWHDLSALRQGFVKPAGWNPQDHVLNGIAWNPDNKHFYLTGKCWPVMFEIKFDEPPTPTPRK